LTLGAHDGNVTRARLFCRSWFFAGLPRRVRRNETLLKIIYEAHIKPDC